MQRDGGLRAVLRDIWEYLKAGGAHGLMIRAICANAQMAKDRALLRSWHQQLAARASETQRETRIEALADLGSLEGSRSVDLAGCQPSGAQGLHVVVSHPLTVARRQPVTQAVCR